MSQWIDRVRKHPVWVLLESVGPAIDLALDRDEIAADAVDSLERLRTVLTFCGKRLASTESVLVLPTTLDALNSNLTQLKVHVEAFTSNGDTSQLNAANAQADNLLSNIISICGTATPDDLTAISEAASSYRTTLEKHLKDSLVIQQQLAEKNAANETKIVAIETTITAEQQRLAVLLTDQQSQFSAAQDKRATDFASTQADYLAKYTTAATEQQTQFSTDQDSRRTAFSELQRDNQQKLTGLITEYDQKLKDHDIEFLNKEKQADDAHKANLEILQTEYQNAATGILSDIQRHKAEVESLVGVIGNLGVTSGYKKVADHARKMLYVWQFLTVGALVGLIVVAYIVAFPQKNATEMVDAAVQLQGDHPGSTQQANVKSVSDKNADASRVETKASAQMFSGSTSDLDFYHGLATRIFLSLTFGIFAAYAGRQASHFFTIEQKNRKLALELEALGPFIEPLEKGDRDKFRVQIGDRSFGVPDHEASKPKEDDPVTVVGWLKSKEVQEAITNQVKEALKGLK